MYKHENFSNDENINQFAIENFKNLFIEGMMEREAIFQTFLEKNNLLNDFNEFEKHIVFLNYTNDGLPFEEK